MACPQPSSLPAVQPLTPQPKAFPGSVALSPKCSLPLSVASSLGE